MQGWWRNAAGGRGRGRGSAQAAAPQRLHAAPATNFSCLAHREQVSKQARSKRASKEACKQAWFGAEESEWGGVVLVVKGIGQGCLIGQDLDGGATSLGQGMGIDGHRWQAKVAWLSLLPFLSLPTHPTSIQCSF